MEARDEIGPAGPNKAYDVFISYASEDRKEVARPLHDQLERRGLDVWFDETVLVPGQSLRRSIDRGLARSRAGVVILSPNFFNKEWPQAELDGLMAREKEEPGILIPVWHEVDVHDVRKYSAMLVDKWALKSSDGIPAVADGVVRAVEMLAAGASAGDTRREAATAAASHERPMPETSRASGGAVSVYLRDLWRGLDRGALAYVAIVALALAGALGAGEWVLFAVLIALALVWPVITGPHRVARAGAVIVVAGLVALGYVLFHSPKPSYADQVFSALATLKAQRERSRQDLESGSLEDRQAAAAALATAHRAARRSIASLGTAPIQLRPVVRPLVTTLGALGDDFSAVVRYAQDDDRRTMNARLRQALRHDAELQDRIGALARATNPR